MNGVDKLEAILRDTPARMKRMSASSFTCAPKPVPRRWEEAAALCDELADMGPGPPEQVIIVRVVTECARAIRALASKRDKRGGE